MGYSISAATLIIFSAIIFSGGVLFGTVFSISENISQSIEEKQEIKLEEMETEINITDTTYNATAETFTISIENTGSVNVRERFVTVLLNGISRDYSFNVINKVDDSVLFPDEKADIKVSNVITEPENGKMVVRTGKGFLF